MSGFVLTRLAKAVAETKYSIEDVVRKATEELEIHCAGFTADNIGEKGMFLHCFAMSGSDLDEIEFIILSHDGKAYIDTVSYQTEVMESGPFAGKTVSFPVSDTFSD